ncbi:MAG: nuclear transport factor 2 family protein, partial [bacterium]
MSQENVETFRRGAEAMQRGDVEAVLRLTHPDVVFEPLREATEGAFLGHAGVRRFLADTAETFELFRPTYADIRDLGDRVLAIGSIRVRGRGSGVETDIPTAGIAEYRAILLWRWKDY